jgi:hypothetical protein
MNNITHNATIPATRTRSNGQNGSTSISKNTSLMSSILLSIVLFVVSALPVIRQKSSAAELMDGSLSSHSRSSSRSSSSLSSISSSPKISWPFSLDDVDVDWSHILPVKLQLLEICEIEPITESSVGIIDIARTTKFPSELLSLWKGFWNPSKNLFHSEDQVRVNLQTIIDYCETGRSTDLSKQQLRFIHQQLKQENSIDVASVLVTLAAHGFVYLSLMF